MGRPLPIIICTEFEHVCLGAVHGIERTSDCRPAYADDRSVALLEGEIATKLRESTEDAEMLGRAGDNADLAWVETESGLDLSEAQRDIEEWRGLRDALWRIEQGSYGICTDCGADVPVERLRSQPLALRCIDCQLHNEQLGRVRPARGQ